MTQIYCCLYVWSLYNQKQGDFSQFCLNEDLESNDKYAKKGCGFNRAYAKQSQVVGGGVNTLCYNFC